MDKMTYTIDDIKVTPSIPLKDQTTTFEPEYTGTGLKFANWVTYPEKNREIGGVWGGKGIGVNISFSMYIYDSE